MTAIKYDVKYELKDAAYDEIFSPPTVSGCFMLLSNVLLQKLNGFDERYFMYLEDVDLCRRALQLTKIYYYLEQLLSMPLIKVRIKANYYFGTIFAPQFPILINGDGFLIVKDMRIISKPYMKFPKK